MMGHSGKTDLANEKKLILMLKIRFYINITFSLAIQLADSLPVNEAPTGGMNSCGMTSMLKTKVRFNPCNG
jgi:hypothetical protein